MKRFRNRRLTSPATRTNQLSLGIIVIFLLPSVVTGVCAQTHDWSQRFGSPRVEHGLDVCLDALGNIFLTGVVQDTVDFGGGDLAGGPGDDIFLAKFDPRGVHLWSRRIGSDGSDVGNGVCTDAQGNVVVTGRFQGMVDFGGGVLESAGSNDIFLAKYDADGVHLWSKAVGDRNDDQGLSVTLDGSGNVIFTGLFSGIVSFGGGALIAAGLSSDVFLVKYDPTGAHIWSQRFGDVSLDTGQSVVADDSNNVVVTGFFQQAVDFGGGALLANAVDVYLAKFDTTGAHLWSYAFGDTGLDTGLGVAVDYSNNVIVTGHFQGAVDFGGGPLSGTGVRDIFLAKLDPMGTHVWSHGFGGVTSDQGLSVSADGSDNVYATGRFTGTVDFGGGGLTSAGFDDIFLARYDPAGSHIWSERFGGSLSDRGNAVRADSSGNLVLTGAFTGTVDFGGGPLMSASATGTDIFLVRYGDPLVAVAIQSFAATAFAGGVALRSVFGSDLRIRGVKVYRGNEEGPLMFLQFASWSGGEFYYEDRTVTPGRTYRYQIAVIDDDGEFSSPVVAVTTTTYGTQLLPNTPNPFNPSTTIRFTLDSPMRVALSIYDARGRRVSTLVDEPLRGGPHEVRWDGTNTAGASVSSGVYFCQLSAGKLRLSRRMVLLK